jgi:hypothetical protein
MSLDLNKLENKLDETLNNETSEELFKWLNYKRRELINSNKKYLEIPHRETIISTNTLQTKPFDNQKIQIMGNKQQTAVEWYIEKLLDLDYEYAKGLITLGVWSERKNSLIEQAKEKYEHEMCVFADEYASYVQEQSKEGIKGAMVSMCAWIFFKNRRR